jgi:phage terminase large subunit-like protein
MAGPEWVFDGSAIADPFGYGERAVECLRQLKHPKSPLPDKSLTLDLWQERIVRRIYGPRHEDGRRIVRTVFLQVGRGNRKTSLGAGLALLHTFGPERIPGGQVISAAADRNQARIAYEEALSIVETVPKLAEAARVQSSMYRLAHRKPGGATYEAVSADGARQHGKTPAFALVDELWAHKKQELWHAIRTGLAKVAGTLLVITTTAGRGSSTPDFPIYEYACKVASGAIIDPGFLPIIFEAPKDCDWRDEAVWHSVNPGLAHGYPDIEGLRQLAHEAASRPADRDAFKQFHLGIRLDYSASPFVDMDVYDAGAAPIAPDTLRGRSCWIGVDMGLTTDLTAVVAAWRDDDDGYTVAAWFFCPGDNLAARADRDGVPYPRWRDEGFIIATPGNVTDYRAVELHLRQLCADFDVREIAFDPAYAQAVMAPLQEDGLPVATMRQGWITMAPAIKELERAIIARRFRHGGNPVLRWCFDNVAIETDKAGNKSFHKGKSRDRIDGAVACAMAVARAANGESTASIYTTEERPAGLLFV